MVPDKIETKGAAPKPQTEFYKDFILNKDPGYLDFRTEAEQQQEKDQKRPHKGAKFYVSRNQIKQQIEENHRKFEPKSRRVEQENRGVNKESKHGYVETGKRVGQENKEKQGVRNTSRLKTEGKFLARQVSDNYCEGLQKMLTGEMDPEDIQGESQVDPKGRQSFISGSQVMQDIDTDRIKEDLFEINSPSGSEMRARVSVNIAGHDGDGKQGVLTKVEKGQTDFGKDDGLIEGGNLENPENMEDGNGQSGQSDKKSDEDSGQIDSQKELESILKETSQKNKRGDSSGGRNSFDGSSLRNLNTVKSKEGSKILGKGSRISIERKPIRSRSRLGSRSTLGSKSNLGSNNGVFSHSRNKIPESGKIAEKG